MCKNLIEAGYRVVVFDIDAKAVETCVALGATAAGSPQELAKQTDNVVTMVPNDAVLRSVVCDEKTGLIHTLKGIHISCSTIHPDTARELALLHKARGSSYVGAPIFARADGVEKRQASFVVGGEDAAVEKALPILECNSSGVFRFGEDAGAGNVVKLCGNFMIASAIESCAEAASLAEKSGVDRVKMMEMLTSTIFDCLIYKGYGMRTAKREHMPGQPLVGPGFQLSLGLKDVTLAQDVAHKVQSPMPFASVLHDRFLASQAKGRGKMDWSAVALLSSEEAGVDVTNWLPKQEGEKK
jgi:3-hydroxyisobutyrate dehydrogenase-like beta-hydroxyacid dehydrogenase